MSLIEQLGGYAQAKNWLDKNEIYVKHGYLEKYRAELLKYRRQHNIFEVGDKVVLMQCNQNNKVVTVKNQIKRNNHDVFTFCEFLGEYISIFFRHATDKEIAAGRRL